MEQADLRGGSFPELSRGYTLYGQVAEVLEDGSAVWIHLFEGRGRQMFCASDDVIITPTG